MISHAKHTFKFAKKRKGPGINIINYTERISDEHFLSLFPFLLVEQKIEMWYLQIAKHLLLPWKTWRWYDKTIARTWILLLLRRNQMVFLTTLKELVAV